MIGLFLSGCFTAADVLSGEIILPGAGAYRYKICAAKAASNNVAVGSVRKGVFREVFSLEKKKSCFWCETNTRLCCWLQSGLSTHTGTYRRSIIKWKRTAGGFVFYPYICLLVLIVFKNPIGSGFQTVMSYAALSRPWLWIQLKEWNRKGGITYLSYSHSILEIFAAPHPLQNATWYQCVPISLFKAAKQHSKYELGGGELQHNTTALLVALASLLPSSKTNFLLLKLKLCWPRSKQ